jgi:2-phospho-L-lactate/phosphoenolpyruvate guanylyltransferase
VTSVRTANARLRRSTTVRSVRTAAILPVKRFSQAKQRLGESVADALRADLARAMVGDVLVALKAAASIERTIVVTREDAVARAAAYLGASVVADGAEQGQSAAVALGVRSALDAGFGRVLCIPGDCPALDAAELDVLLASAPVEPVADGEPATDGRPAADGQPDLDTQVVIVPDRHGTGTNGLLLTPPDAIAPSFGPDSRARHQALARDAGASCRVESVASLLLDIDTGADLAVLRERLAGERERAPRTRVVLGLTARAGSARAGAAPTEGPLSAARAPAARACAAGGG